MAKAAKSELTVEMPDVHISDTEKSPTPVRKIKLAYDIDLNILLKFIKPYDGSRETLNSFIVNCNNTLELASETQKPIVFKYILSQLQGKAEIACSIKEFHTWDQLKEFLKTQFCQRKHYAHLITELQECKQNTDTVTQFSLKIETCLSQLLTEISLNPTKVKEVPGRVAAMEDLALHHFIMGLNPRLSNILRCRAPKTLNEAINFAISEERIQESIYKSNSKSAKPQFKTTNGNSSNNNNPQRSYGPTRPISFKNQPQRSNEVCRYCKAVGHDINNCYKRKFQVEQLRRQNPPNFSKPRVNYIEDDQFVDDANNDLNEDEGRDEVDFEAEAEIEADCDNLNY